MSEFSSPPGSSARRRRADAQRSVEAILDAGAALLAENPHASMNAIAARAGLTRQTVYAHFTSRDALVEALTDRATDRVVHALDAAGLDRLPAAEALARLLRISWDEFEAASYLLALPGASSSEHEHERHQPVLRYVSRIAERGKREGDFDPELPVSWITTATMALGHAAGEQVGSGVISVTQARALLTRALRVLFAPEGT